MAKNRRRMAMIKSAAPQSASKTVSLKDELVFLLDQAYNKRAWHGTNLKGSIRGLKADQALWRPAPNLHNIWENVIHAAYWKYIIWRKLTDQTKSSFLIKGSNWFKLAVSPDEKQWKFAVSLLEKYHALLRQAVADLPASKLSRSAEKSIWKYYEMITGGASHDLYHAGQIQLLKRLMKAQER
jgi:hypothetical protein